jgi:gluconate 2-dehydrogenase gamma chain
VSTTGLLFFFVDEINALDALVARIVPGDASDPGAREAGVTEYIDRALAGPYKEWGLQYHEGLRLVNAYALEAFGKKLHALADDEQDAVVGAMEAGKVPGFEDGGAAFFAMVWAHTIEGLLCDPAYGGNKDAVGWKLIGFPGAQYGYTAEQMQYGKDLTTLPIMTLADIQKMTEERPELFYSRSGSFLTPSREEVPAMPSEENTLDTAKNQGG